MIPEQIDKGSSMLLHGFIPGVKWSEREADQKCPLTWRRLEIPIHFAYMNQGVGSKVEWGI
jgi:hypothetical protein